MIGEVTNMSEIEKLRQENAELKRQLENQRNANKKPYEENNLKTRTLTLVPDVIDGNMIYVTVTMHRVPQSAASSIFVSRFKSISEMLKESAETIEKCLYE